MFQTKAKVNIILYANAFVVCVEKKKMNKPTEAPREDKTKQK